MTTVEILKAARAQIDTPAKWSQDGYGEYYKDRGPVCSLGALRRIGGTEPCGETPVVSAAARVFARVIGVSDCMFEGGRYWYEVGDFNDSHTHAEVLAAFDRAIANEEAKAQEFTAEALPTEMVS